MSLIKKIAVTGGSGFIGAYLVKRLVSEGYEVKVFDNLMRGSLGRLENLKDKISFVNIDIRDEDRLAEELIGFHNVIHLAAINGTENFYKNPELVLDVGIRGALAVVKACRNSNVRDLIIASSAEVYQTPSKVPTDENIELMLPDSLNPRYSYGGSKIISELIAFNYAKDFFDRVQVFRPHNVYGPDMGSKHVIPQFILRIKELLKSRDSKINIQFPIQGSGKETRAFCYVDDIVDGILIILKKGSHREIYHIGNDYEISINELAYKIAYLYDLKIDILPSEELIGGTSRRCPNIAKMKKLGYAPKVKLIDGLRETIDWYSSIDNLQTNNKLI